MIRAITTGVRWLVQLRIDGSSARGAGTDLGKRKLIHRRYLNLFIKMSTVKNTVQRKLTGVKIVSNDRYSRSVGAGLLNFKGRNRLMLLLTPVIFRETVPLATFDPCYFS